MADQINHPDHYNCQPFECFVFVDELNFNTGNIFKYIWRCELKGKKLEDIGKSSVYATRTWDKSKGEPEITGEVYEGLKVKLAQCIFPKIQENILNQILTFAYTGKVADIIEVLNLITVFENQAKEAERKGKRLV